MRIELTTCALRVRGSVLRGRGRVGSSGAVECALRDSVALMRSAGGYCCDLLAHSQHTLPCFRSELTDFPGENPLICYATSRSSGSASGTPTFWARFSAGVSHANAWCGRS